MALIKCPECGHQMSDAAKKCPNCGAPLKKSTIKVERNVVISCSLLIVALGLLIGSIAIMCHVGYDFITVDDKNFFLSIGLFVGSFIPLYWGLNMLHNKLKKSKQIFWLSSIIFILAMGSVFLIRGCGTWEDEYNRRNEFRQSKTSDSSTTSISASDPNNAEYYYGTWEYRQPNNQDGVQNLKLVVNPDETVQAIVNVNGKEFTVYGSWDWISKRLWMSFNDTEEHINGLLYIDHLRIFKDYNDYFGIKYGNLKTGEDGITYLYEDSSDAEAKNPNKRVEIKKID